MEAHRRLVIEHARGRRVFPPASVARAGEIEDEQLGEEVGSMQRKSLCGRHAFTLVEVMIIVALIGLLAALMIPSFIKVRKQSQGKRILNDVRQIDAAINSWALEVNVSDGTPVDLSAAGQYTKVGVIKTVDVLGNPYAIGPVGDSQVTISATTKTALTGVNIDWGAY